MVFFSLEYWSKYSETPIQVTTKNRPHGHTVIL